MWMSVFLCLKIYFVQLIPSNLDINSISLTIDAKFDITNFDMW